jgi:L-alanine-DL-glutamate epimerase-like enolase superfamily enzyme
VLAVLYEQLAPLPLVVESYALDGLDVRVAAGWTRRTTVVRLRGDGEEGLGEDVNYEAELQEAFQAAGPSLDLAGSHSVDSFSELLEPLGLDDYRRWAFESAALDLALRQAGRSLADALGRTPQPVRFVVSMGLGDPPSAGRLHRLLELYPGTRFKLDPTGAWSDELIDELAALGTVDTLDFKGVYRGGFGEPADAALYRRIAEAFPDAWLEDPGLGDAAADKALAPHRDRITWDAPIHSVSDIDALLFRPTTLNFKPSRFGTVHRLFEAYLYCVEHGIGIYGGGQFELGPGRGQIQLLASLFHPDAPNDVAPAGYNTADPGRGLPQSPLEPPIARVGLVAAATP